MIFYYFLESRVCASSVPPVPCSALVFAHKLLFQNKFCPGKKVLSSKPNKINKKSCRFIS